MKLLFNGSRESFTQFDPVYVGTGENVTNEEQPSWYFTDNLKGAFYHVERYLRSAGTGSVQVCLIEEQYLQEANEYPDSIYQCHPLVVPIQFSENITIVESLPTSMLLSEIIGPVKTYVLGDTPEPLGNTGLLSKLRVV